MAVIDPSPSSPPSRLLRKRVVFPAIILGTALALFLALWFRGTMASAIATDPGSPADGILTQLFLTPEGRKVVRCAALLDRPLAVAWKAVTDYPHFERIFPTVTAVKSSVEADGRFHLACEVSSKLGTWPIDIRIRHQESAEKCIASWDEPTGDVVVNRGNWTLSAAPQARTLVVYTLDVEVKPIPNFLVRAVLLARQRMVVEALKGYLDQQRP